MILGRTGIEVSELCFGALPMGPLQKDLAPAAGAEIILAALKGGINFIDTAELYQTYEPIARALRQAPTRPVIASKSMATDYDGMRRAVFEARQALGVGVIDIFHLHAARVAANDNVFSSRAGALKALVECRTEGLIRAVGISTHSVPTVFDAAEQPEIDIVFPLLNQAGTGILHGTIEEMIRAIRCCLDRNKGLYLMKALAGGALVSQYHAALSFVRSRFAVPLALGMVNREEVAYNLSYFATADDQKSDLPQPVSTVAQKAFRIVRFLCRDCGTCIESCPNQAIGRPEADSKPQIDPDLCLRCGYCVGHCPEFAIRMV